MTHIAIFVKDLDLMEEFYQRLFKMKTIWKKTDDKAYLTTGSGDIFALLQNAHERKKIFHLAQITVDQFSTPNFPHFGIVVDSEEEFQALLDQVRQSDLQVAGPKTSRDTTHSFYILDPEGNPVQIVWPPREYFESVLPLPMFNARLDKAKE